jgi:hypothetical protein
MLRDLELNFSRDASVDYHVFSTHVRVQLSNQLFHQSFLSRNGGFGYKLLAPHSAFVQG